MSYNENNILDVEIDIEDVVKALNRVDLESLKKDQLEIISNSLYHFVDYNTKDYKDTLYAGFGNYEKSQIDKTFKKVKFFSYADYGKELKATERRFYRTLDECEQRTSAKNKAFKSTSTSKKLTQLVDVRPQSIENQNEEYQEESKTKGNVIDPKIEGKFWEIYISGKKLKVDFSLVSLNKILDTYGYCRVKSNEDEQTFVCKIVNNRLRLVTKYSLIQDDAIDWIKKHSTVLNGKEILVENAFREKFTEREIDTKVINGIKLLNSSLVRDTDDTAFHFYRNGYVVINKDKIDFFDYSKLKGIIWESQVIDRNFELIDSESMKLIFINHDFARFLRHTCIKETDGILFPDDDRYRALRLTIGYLLHGYKDAECRYAVSFTEDNPQLDTQQGGTGKGLIAEAIKKIITTAYINASTADLKKDTLFYECSFSTRMVWFDEANSNFPFGYLLSVIEHAVTIRSLYGKPYKILADQFAKIIFQGNFSFGKLQSTDQRRIYDMQILSFFNEERTPKEFLKLDMIFWKWKKGDKPDKRWNEFDNLMMFYLFEYLKYIDECRNSGKKIKLPEYVSNVAERKLRASAGDDFADFMLSKECECYRNGAKFKRKDLFETYHKTTGLSQPNYDKVTSKDWKKSLVTFASFLGKNLMRTNDTSETSLNPFTKEVEVIDGRLDYFG